MTPLHKYLLRKQLSDAVNQQSDISDNIATPQPSGYYPSMDDFDAVNPQSDFYDNDAPTKPSGEYSSMEDFDEVNQQSDSSDNDAPPQQPSGEDSSIDGSPLGPVFILNGLNLPDPSSPDQPVRGRLESSPDARPSPPSLPREPTRNGYLAVFPNNRIQPFVPNRHTGLNHQRPEASSSSDATLSGTNHDSSEDSQISPAEPVFNAQQTPVSPAPDPEHRDGLEPRQKKIAPSTSQTPALVAAVVRGIEAQESTEESSPTSDRDPECAVAEARENSDTAHGEVGNGDHDR